MYFVTYTVSISEETEERLAEAKLWPACCSLEGTDAYPEKESSATGLSYVLSSQRPLAQQYFLCCPLQVFKECAYISRISFPSSSAWFLFK